MDGRPTDARVTFTRWNHMTRFQVTDLRFPSISRLFMHISIHRRYPESLNLGRYRRRETVLLVVYSEHSLDRRVSSSLEVVIVRRTSQCQLRMIFSQLPDQTFDDSNQILQVRCESKKFVRSCPKTNTSCHTVRSHTYREPSSLTSSVLFQIFEISSRTIPLQTLTSEEHVRSRIPVPIHLHDRTV